METKLSEEQRQEPEIGFRAVGEADADFLFKVYVCTREQEMNMVPWSEEQKEAFLRSQFLAQQQQCTTKTDQCDARAPTYKQAQQHPDHQCDQ